jgi:hypothetical protein
MISASGNEDFLRNAGSLLQPLRGRPRALHSYQGGPPLRGIHSTGCGLDGGEGIFIGGRGAANPSLSSLAPSRQDSVRGMPRGDGKTEGSRAGKCTRQLPRQSHNHVSAQNEGLFAPGGVGRLGAESCPIGPLLTARRSLSWNPSLLSIVIHAVYNSLDTKRLICEWIN